MASPMDCRFGTPSIRTSVSPTATAKKVYGTDTFTIPSRPEPGERRKPVMAPQAHS